jgi:hypothetical protein
MKPDRLLQQKVLESLREHYPEVVEIAEFPFHQRDPQFMGNLFYLEEHGLIQAIAKRVNVCNAAPEIFTAKITAKGIDFLEDDGGVDAILKTITIKFDPEDLIKLIEAKIEKSPLKPEEKSSILKVIKQLPAEGLKELSKKLIKETRGN